jgi:PBP1b-binding outer membrane lipoprotein LpoB
MGWLKVLTITASVLFIAGCASPDPPPPKKTVFDPLLQAEERAKDVQKTVDQHADSTRKAVDTQERGDTAP